MKALHTRSGKASPAISSSEAAESHIGDFRLVLRPAQVLPEDSRVERKSHHVWLGMDLAGQAKRVTLDLESMRLVPE